MHANARGARPPLRGARVPRRASPELRLAPAELVEEFGRCHVRGHDSVMELPTAFGLGFEHTIPEWPFGPGPRTYGHNGSGRVARHRRSRHRRVARLRDEPSVVGTRPHRPALAAASSTRSTPCSDGSSARRSYPDGASHAEPSATSSSPADSIGSDGETYSPAEQPSAQGDPEWASATNVVTSTSSRSVAGGPNRAPVGAVKALRRPGRRP